MSVDVAVSHPQVNRGSVSRSTAETRGWIHSPAFDLSLFTFSGLAGLFVLWANGNLPGGAYIVLLATYLVAIPHYMSSFSFFLGDDNLAYYRTRRLAFFVGPVVILLLVILLRVLRYDAVVQSTMFTWNIYHVAAQSIGILSIYRRLNSGAVSERIAARTAILSSNALFAFWYIDRFPPLYNMLTSVHPAVPAMLRFVLLPIAVASLLALGFQLYRRPKAVSFAEIAFLVSSIALFHPYLWVQDSAQATFAMLMGHFIQYLAIVWLLNRRKYAEAGGSARQRLLGRVSSRPILLFGSLAATGTLFYLIAKATAFVGAPMIYVVAWNALTLVHFYLDGLVWAFKRPFVRASIGPYLAPQSHVVP